MSTRGDNIDKVLYSLDDVVQVTSKEQLHANEIVYFNSDIHKTPLFHMYWKRFCKNKECRKVFLEKLELGNIYILKQ